MGVVLGLFTIWEIDRIINNDLRKEEEMHICLCGKFVEELTDEMCMDCLLDSLAQEIGEDTDIGSGSSVRADSGSTEPEDPTA